MDLVGVSASPSVSGVLDEPQGLRRSLRAQTRAATKATPMRVVSPYFAKKPGVGRTAKKSVAISAKTEAGAVLSLIPRDVIHICLVKASTCRHL